MDPRRNLPPQAQTSEWNFRTDAEARMAEKYLREIEKLSPELSVAKFPIEKSFQHFNEAFGSSEAVILSSPPGSGKSLDVGAWLLKIMGNQARVAMTQPRRDAAENVAVATAARHGLNFGKDVCFTTSEFHGNRPETRLKIMTTAVLVNMFRDNSTLANIDAVVIDEAHERDLNIDLTMALLKRANKLRKEHDWPVVKLVLVSATADDQKFRQAFNIPETGVVRTEGKMYKVERRFANESEVFIGDQFTKEPKRREVDEIAAGKAAQILKSTESGDILIFMPGIRRIQNTQRHLERLLRNELPGSETEAFAIYGGKMDIAILHSSCTQSERSEVLKGNKDRNVRRVVISTNIAETSVTVPGIKYVIDSGLKNETHYNQDSGLEALLEVPASQSESSQRAGRAGRLEEGEWFACYTQEDYEKMEKHPVPEIKRLDLSGAALNILALGIKDFENLEFVDQPDKAEVLDAISKLEMLGAIDGYRKLTKTGELMSKLPLEPRLGRVVAEAVDLGCVREALIVSLASHGKGFMLRDRRNEEDRRKSPPPWQAKRQEMMGKSQSDWDYFFRLFDGYLKDNNPKQFCLDHGLDEKEMEKIWADFSKIIQEIKRSGFEISSSRQLRSMERSLLAGYAPDHLIKQTTARHGVEYERVDRSDKQVRISSSSVLRNRGTDLAVAMELSPGKGQKTVGRGRMEDTEFKYAVGVHGVSSEDLFQVISQRVKKSPEPVSFDFDRSQRRILGTYKYQFKTRDNSWTDLPEQQLAVESSKAIEALADALIYGITGGSLQEQMKLNSEIAKILDDLHVRSRGQIVWPSLKSWLVNRLGTADLNIAESKGVAHYALKLEEICSADRQALIEHAAPITVSLRGYELPIKYEFASGDLNRNVQKTFTATLILKFGNEQEVLQFLQEISDTEIQAARQQIAALREDDRFLIEASLYSITYGTISREFKSVEDFRSYILSLAVDRKISNGDIRPNVADIPYKPGAGLPDFDSLGILPINLGAGPWSRELVAYPYAEEKKYFQYDKTFIVGFEIKYGGQELAQEKNLLTAKELREGGEYRDKMYMIKKIMDFVPYGLKYAAALVELGLKERADLVYKLQEGLRPFWDGREKTDSPPELNGQILEYYGILESLQKYAEELQAKMAEAKKYRSENIGTVQTYFQLADDEQRLFKPGQWEISQMRDEWNKMESVIARSNSQVSVSAAMEKMRQIAAAAEFYLSPERQADLEARAAKGEIIFNQIFTRRHNGVKRLPNELLAIGPDGQSRPADLALDGTSLWRIVPGECLFVTYRGPNSGGSRCYENSSFEIIHVPVEGTSQAQLTELQKFENGIITANADYSGAGESLVRHYFADTLPSYVLTGKAVARSMRDVSAILPEVPLSQNVAQERPSIPVESFVEAASFDSEADKRLRRESQDKLDRLNQIMNWAKQYYQKTFQQPDLTDARAGARRLSEKLGKKDLVNQGELTAIGRLIDKALNNSQNKLKGKNEKIPIASRILDYLNGINIAFNANEALREYSDAGLYDKAQLLRDLHKEDEKIFAAVVSGENLPTPEQFVENFVNSL